MSTEAIKDPKEDLHIQQVKKVFSQLLHSPKGLTTIEVATKNNLKDHREVRVLIREALREAKKRKFIVSKDRLQGKAMKVYNISSPEAQKDAPMVSKV